MHITGSLPHPFSLEQSIPSTFTFSPAANKSKCGDSAEVEGEFSCKWEVGHCIHAHTHDTTPGNALGNPGWTESLAQMGVTSVTPGPPQIETSPNGQ